MTDFPYKTGFIIVLGMTFYFSIFGCSGNNDSAAGPGGMDYTYDVFQSDCLPETDSPRSNTERMVLEADGNDLHVKHLNAYYNCGLAYVVDYRFDGTDITGFEADTGAPADCICYFNLESVIYDLKIGTYNVTLLGIPADSIRDTIGVESITIGGPK